MQCGASRLAGLQMCCSVMLDALSQQVEGKCQIAQMRLILCLCYLLLEKLIDRGEIGSGLCQAFRRYTGCFRTLATSLYEKERHTRTESNRFTDQAIYLSADISAVFIQRCVIIEPPTGANCDCYPFQSSL